MRFPRRANVIGIFPNDAAIVKLVGATVIEQTEERHLIRFYMSQESLAKVLNPEESQRMLEALEVA